MKIRAHRAATMAAGIALVALSLAPGLSGCGPGIFLTDASDARAPVDATSPLDVSPDERNDAGSISSEVADVRADDDEAAICPAGTSACSNGCHDLATDPENCGRCGFGCHPHNGIPRCVAGRCDPLCPAGTHSCDGFLCTPVDSPRGCGSSCTPCPTPPNGYPTCDGTRCDFACEPGFHRCGDQCLDDLDVASCGSLCTPCPAPAHAIATCSAVACDSVCVAGFGSVNGACVPSVQPLAPISTSNVASQTPTLHWALPAGTDGVRLELCRDRAMSSECTSLDVTGHEFTPATPLRAGVWYWRLQSISAGVAVGARSPIWQFVAPARTATHDAAWISATDFDADGFADLAVSAEPSDLGFGRHRVDVYAGGAAGLPTSPTATLLGPPRDRYSDDFGESVGVVGDVNGDGFGDLVVGSRWGVYGRGLAYLFVGGPHGLSSMPATRLTYPEARWQEFAYFVVGVGDVNGDGYGDIAVPATMTRTIRVYAGGPAGVATTPSWTFTGMDTIAGAGDVNADGFADVVTASRDGLAQLRLGHASGLVETPEFVLDIAERGARIAGGTAGDVNNDGYADFIVSSPDAPNTGSSGGPGRVYVFLGASTGVASLTPAITLASQPPPFVSHAFGSGTSTAGDVDGDGYSDVIVGDGANGRAFVFRGGATGLSTIPCTTIDAPSPSREGFGSFVAGGGDVDGDGFADVLVANPFVVYRGGARCVENTPVRNYGPHYGYGAPSGAL